MLIIIRKNLNIQIWSAENKPAGGFSCNNKQSFKDIYNNIAIHIVKRFGFSNKLIADVKAVPESEISNYSEKGILLRRTVYTELS